MSFRFIELLKGFILAHHIGLRARHAKRINIREMEN